jgi:hypothetical protein
LAGPEGPFGIGARLSGSFRPRHRLPPCIGYSTTRRFFHSRVPPQGRTHSLRYRNVDLFPIAYASRPRLRDRLTRSGSAWLRNPWAFGDRDSHPVSRVLIPASSLPCAPPVLFRAGFDAQGTLPYHGSLPKECSIRSFGGVLQSRPLSAQIHLTSELLRTLSRYGCF